MRELWEARLDNAQTWESQQVVPARKGSWHAATYLSTLSVRVARLGRQREAVVGGLAHEAVLRVRVTVVLQKNTIYLCWQRAKKCIRVGTPPLVESFWEISFSSNQSLSIDNESQFTIARCCVSGYTVAGTHHARHAFRFVSHNRGALIALESGRVRKEDESEEENGERLHHWKSK